MGNYLFRAAKLIKHVVDLHKYPGYGIGFERKGFFSTVNEIGRNVIIFEVDMSSSLKFHNKGKDTLYLWKGPTQRSGEHSLTSEKLY